MDKLEVRLSHDFSGPVLFHYVWWVLNQAQEKGIHTLYFLARDGYLLREIAELFCHRFQLPIQCRYLYCSRTSLRIPSYHLIGEEAYQLLLIGGYQVSRYTLLQRLGLSKEERSAVYKDCGFTMQDEMHLLNPNELNEVRDAFKESDVYRTFVLQRSKAAYRATIGYFYQEGLFSDEKVALVDSGWTGSMQRSLRQLLQSAGYQGALEGFYFGMYAKPKEAKDGKYNSWYFDNANNNNRKIFFCNNLFECILSAPHGTTTGYIYNGDTYNPILSPPPRGAYLQHIEDQIRDIRSYVVEHLPTICFEQFNTAKLRDDTCKRVKRYMGHPTAEEASYYGNFLFCDDVTEAYQMSLADASQIGLLKKYAFIPRMVRYLTHRYNATPELFWPYGTIAFLPRWKQCWYRSNIYLWEWIRYELRKSE